MTVTAKAYGNFAKALLEKKIDYLTDTVKVVLLTSVYVPDQDVHDGFADLTGQVVGTGYTAGGAALGTKTLTYDAATNEVRMSAADTVWPASTITARYAAVYDDTHIDKPLICYIDFGSDKSSSDGDFKIEWASGIVAKITAAA